MPIPIIDLFAGPGGLGEGFSRFRDDRHRPVFRIGLSIEKDPVAHKTLELRAFFRQFTDGKAPDEYYEYLAGNITREALFESCPVAAKAAGDEAWNATLGVTKAAEIDARITAALAGRKNWLLIGGPPCQAYSLGGEVRVFDRTPFHRHTRVPGAGRVSDR